jgi:hypothetical protein
LNSVNNSRAKIGLPKYEATAKATKEIVGYAIVDPISGDIVASKKTIAELMEASKKLEKTKGFEDMSDLVYEIVKKDDKNVIGNKVTSVDINLMNVEKGKLKKPTTRRSETEFNELKEKISNICHDKLGIGITSSNLSTVDNTEYTFEPRTKDSKYDGMMLSYDGDEFEVFEFGMATNNNKDTFKVFGRYKNLQAAINSLSKGNTENRNKTTRKAPIKKAVAKKVVEGLKPKFKVGDYVSMFKDEPSLEVIGVNEFSDKKATYDLKSKDGKIDRRNISELKLSTSTKPKADHKKLVAKLKAKKGAKEYDNRASLNTETGERRKRSESSDKKRDALPLGKRVSADGNVYWENRLNRGDLDKGDKFEEGGEVKGSGWGLNLNW